jgi:hypothetical protein
LTVDPLDRIANDYLSPERASRDKAESTRHPLVALKPFGKITSLGLFCGRLGPVCGHKHKLAPTKTPLKVSGSTDDAERTQN